MPIGLLLELGIGIQGRCQVCREAREVDLAAVIMAKGGDFTFFNRSAPCRYTEGCKGRVRFFRMSPFCQHFSEHQEYYWDELDYLEEHSADPLWRRMEARRRVDEMFAPKHNARRR